MHNITSIMDAGKENAETNNLFAELGNTHSEQKSFDAPNFEVHNVFIDHKLPKLIDPENNFNKKIHDIQEFELNEEQTHECDRKEEFSPPIHMPFQENSSETFRNILKTVTKGFDELIYLVDEGILKPVEHKENEQEDEREVQIEVKIENNNVVFVDRSYNLDCEMVSDSEDDIHSEHDNYSDFVDGNSEFESSNTESSTKQLGSAESDDEKYSQDDQEEFMESPKQLDFTESDNSEISKIKTMAKRKIKKNDPLEENKENSDISDSDESCASDVQPECEEENVYINPYYSNINGGIIASILTIEIMKEYKRVIILCLKNNITKKGRTIVNSILLNEDSDEQELAKSAKYVRFVEGSTEMLNIMHHKNVAQFITIDFLKIFSRNFKVSDKEIVIPMLNITEDKAIEYAKLYNQTVDFEKQSYMKYILDYYGNKDRSVIRNLKTKLITSGMTAYWTKYHNCAINFTSFFKQRMFSSKPNLKKSMKDKISKQNSGLFSNEQNKESAETNYIEGIGKQNVHTDISMALKYKDYILYESKEATLTEKQVTDIYSTCTTESDLYNITCSLLMSVENSHLVLKNVDLMTKLKPLFDKFAPVIKYIMNYVWLSYYLEECSNKGKTTKNNRYIFTAEQASLLPVYPYDNKNPHLNPYSSVMLVNEEVLNASKNILGLSMVKNYKDYGIANTQEFKTNFNIFTTGKKDKNILDKLNFFDENGNTRIVVSGSCMTACCQKKNPLELRYYEDDNYDIEKVKNAMFSELYAESDIDVMIYSLTNDEYIKTAYEIYDVVTENVKTLYNKTNVSIESVKSLFIIVSLEYFVENHPEYDKEYIINNIHANEIREIIYREYVEIKCSHNKQQRQRGQDQRKESYYKLVDYSEMSICLSKQYIDEKSHEDFDNEFYIKKSETKLEFDNIEAQEEAVELNNELTEVESKEREIKEIMSESNLNEHRNSEPTTNKILMKICEGVKYKIKSPSLKHPIEIFRSKYNEFFSLVSNFHMCNVRAYWDSVNVHHCPSSIISQQVLMNPDYKYVAGSKSPMDIFLKTLSRGAGIYCSQLEIKACADFVKENKKWSTVLGKSSKHKHLITGSKTIYSDITQVGKWDHLENKINSKYAIDASRNVECVESFADFEQEWKTRYGYTNNKYINFLQLRSINEKGFVVPLNRNVVIEAYDLLC
jgi:hypothetical protein